MKNFLIIPALMLFSSNSNAEHFLVSKDAVQNAIVATTLGGCHGSVKEVHADAYTVRATTFDDGGCDMKSEHGKITSLFTVQRDGAQFPETMEVVTSRSDSDVKGAFSEILTYTENNNEEFSSMWESALAKEQKESQNRGY
ncbi:hypothetical protein [Caballeronia mineralivorans]|jgi:hypothetical protein|uniref:hypothetical protein n=1 Tax=Caballeronia mineralivorans TaxID=2010198 RepID=UPI002AFDE232|nr:hypothetical protein [Caballeronia mineralivorans]MEA3098857.1 hypothetical protein [Caballeronia mineralivorans]